MLVFEEKWPRYASGSKSASNSDLFWVLRLFNACVRVFCVPNATILLVYISIHTYIIGYYNPSVRIIDLVSHTTYVVCVNFIRGWRDLQFKADSERQIFFLRNFSWQFYSTLRVFPRNLLRGNYRRNTFRILFWCLAWSLNPGFSSNKPINYLLDHCGWFTQPPRSKCDSSEKMIFFCQNRHLL